MTATLRRHAPALLLGALSVAVIVAAAWRMRAAWVGDAAVYLPYARNAADGHLFQFNVGEFSSGATGVLWSLVLAVPFVLGGGLAAAKVVGALAAVAGFAAVVAAARRLSGSWTAGAIGGLFVLGTMPFYAVSLYESGLVVALAALALIAGDRAVRAWTAEERLTLGALAPLIAVWAALPLTRPDAVVLVGAQAIALLALAPADRRAAIRPLLVALVVAALPAAAYFGWSLADLGTPSTSSQGRAFALQETGRHWIGPLYRSDDAIRELLRSPWVFGVLPALAGLALVLRSGERAARWFGLHGALVLAGYVGLLTFVTPGLFDTPRYLLPVVPVVASAVAVLLVALRPRVPAAAALAGGAAVALLLGLTGLHTLRDGVRYARAIGITEQEVFERDVVDRVDALAAPGDTLLAYEVQLRYFLPDDVRVLSEDGITDGRVRPYQDDRDMTGFLRRYRPRWWIADRNVDVRPYLQGTILQRARAAFRADPSLRHVTLDGITFTLEDRRDRPLAAGFGGWELLIRLDY